MMVCSLIFHRKDGLFVDLMCGLFVGVAVGLVVGLFVGVLVFPQCVSSFIC